MAKISGHPNKLYEMTSLFKSMSLKQQIICNSAWKVYVGHQYVTSCKYSVYKRMMFANGTHLGNESIKEMDCLDFYPKSERVNS